MLRVRGPQAGAGRIGRQYMRIRWQIGPGVGWRLGGKYRRHRRLLSGTLGRSRGVILTLKREIK